MKRKNHPLQKNFFPCHVCTAVFIEKCEKVLLLQQARKGKDKKWGPPAGGLEAFETPEECIIRETREETGLDICLNNIVGIYFVSRGKKSSGIAIFYRAEIRGGKLFDFPTEEILQVKWLSCKELKKLKKTDIYRPEYNLPALKNYLKGMSYPLDLISLRNHG